MLTWTHFLSWFVSVIVIRQLQIEMSTLNPSAWTSHSGAACTQVLDPPACFLCLGWKDGRTSVRHPFIFAHVSISGLRNRLCLTMRPRGDPYFETFQRNVQALSHDPGRSSCKLDKPLM